MKKKKMKRLKNIKRMLTAGAATDGDENAGNADEVHVETRKQSRQKSKRERLKQILKGSDRRHYEQNNEMVIQIPSPSKSHTKKKEGKGAHEKSKNAILHAQLDELKAEIAKNAKKQARRKKKSKKKSKGKSRK